MLQNPDDAVIWRGPRKNALIKQFLKDVDWGVIDYLVVDAPPGYGLPCSDFDCVFEVLMHLQGMGCPALMHVLFDCGCGVLMHLQGKGCPALMHVLFDCGFRVFMHLQGMGVFDCGFRVLMHLPGMGCPALMLVYFECGFGEKGVKSGGVGGARVCGVERQASNEQE